MSPSRSSRFVPHWLDRLAGTRAVRGARERLQAQEPWRRAAIGSACVALELADRVLRPMEPMRHPGSEALALSVCRQALVWTLRVANEVGDAPELGDPASWLEAVPQERLGPIARGALDRVRALLVRSFVDDASVEVERLREEASLLRDVAAELLEPALAPEHALERALQQRRRRLALMGAFVCCALFAAMRLRGPAADLAAGKPWRTSSSLATCEPAKHLCAGTKTDILFHTLEEDSPWFELDLGAPTRFSVVEVQNRADGFPERAIPLVVEVGDDGRTFRLVAVRAETFTTWRAELATQTARFVRVRATNRTFLHLESVKIFR
jgi:hypothetical protein